ncbi:RNA-binding protein with serine-rich domain 1-like isoform X1 [Phycodurus eques]|uniref:RNA-binding protein with serine-rich domain 1-like isoform X1 n=1 Tax=Phycodurus eques TaxID=693459 RepID=UPI002ACE5D65|nr:RNA-binding protein with serine-rich domain 1-like isoform X1 [Phycodurus eques]
MSLDLQTASLLNKKEDDKSKQGLKQKSGASKDWPEKDQGGVKNQTQRSASSGSSSSSSSSGSGSSSSSSTSSSASSSSSSRSSSSSSSTSPSPIRQRHNRQRSSSKSKLAKKDDRERRRRSPAPKPTKVYLGRLTRNVIKEHIQEIFSTYGKIKMIDMPMNRVHPHLSKGYAYIEFETPEEAEKALIHMDGDRWSGDYSHSRPDSYSARSTSEDVPSPQNAASTPDVATLSASDEEKVSQAALPGPTQVLIARPPLPPVPL